MICKKCGANVADNSKFCIYCGNPMQDVPKTIQSNEQQEVNVNPTNNESISFVESNVDTIVNNNNMPITQQSINDEQPVNNEVTKPTSSNNKNCGLMFAIIGGILGILVILGLVFMLKGTKESGSIDTLKRALGKFATINSGTVNTKIEMKSNTGDSMSLSATAKFVQKNDNYDLSLTINKSLFNEEMSLYTTINSDELKLYVESKLIDMLESTYSDTNIWLNHSLNFSELGINFDDINERSLDLKKVLDDENFKYIDITNNLKHYQLIIDEKLIKKIETLLKDEGLESEIEDIEDTIDLDESIILDFYMDSNDNLVKISIDLASYIDDESISSLLVSVEFVDFNNTIINIPNEALSSTTDLDTYIDLYSSYDWDDDYDWNDDYEWDDENSNLEI